MLPDARLSAAPTPGRRPAVVLWQYVYCALMALLYLGVAIAGAVMAIFRHQMVDETTTPNELLVMGLILFAVGLAFAVPFVAAPLLPRRRWVWVLHLVLIAVGMTSCACLPACIPLLVFWIRPDTQAWFGGLAQAS